jgi:ribonuclease Z
MPLARCTLAERERTRRVSTPELIVLGSSSHLPTARRNQGGYLLRWAREGLLFDPGEGMQRQMAIFGVRASRVTRILITHFHGDHCLGLPGVLQRLRLEATGRAIDVYFPASGRVFYERLRGATIQRAEPGVRAHALEQPGVFARVAGLRFEAQRLCHTVDAFGYRIQEEDGRTFLPERLAAAGIRGAAVGELVRRGVIEVAGRATRLEEVSVPRPGQSMAFVMDTRPCDGARELARGVDLLVCEATYLHADLRLARERGHMTAREAATLAREAGSRRLVLGHVSPRYASDGELLEEARALHPDVVLAEDGARIALPARPRPQGEARSPRCGLRA